MKVYHHNDNDGKCSAAIVWDALKGNLGTAVVKELKDNIINFYEVDYPVGHEMDPPGIDSIKEDERIYILDYSFSPEYIKKILKITNNITWIDHHKTAIFQVKPNIGIIESIESILSLEKAACMLTWEYFHGDTDAPEAVKLIQAYDIWNLDYSEYVEPFKEGLSLYDHGPFDPIWESLLHIPKFSGKGPKWLEIAEVGKTCLEYNRRKNKEFINRFGFEVTYLGYKCIVCGKPEGSRTFGDKAYDYDIMITFSYDGSRWIVSLYTVRDDIDVSKIAKERGGGGHKKAAGFTTKKPPIFLMGVNS